MTRMMHTHTKTVPWLIALLLPLLAPAAWGQAVVGLGGEPVVKIETVWSGTPAKPGDQLALAVVLDIREKFHINPDQPQLTPGFEYLIPTELKVTATPADVKLGPVQFPKAHDVPVNYTGEAQTLRAWEGRTVLYLPVMVDPAAAGGTRQITLTLTYQACDDKSCLPPRDEVLTVDLPVTTGGEPATPGDTALFTGFDPSVFAALASGKVENEVTLDVFGWSIPLDAGSAAGFTLLLLLSGLGGLLLNFTPCVLPVIPIKIMGLQHHAGDRVRMLLLGAVMSLGVIVFWLALGVAISFISGFKATNQLFQTPVFTIGVGVVIAVMAVGMCGLFAVRLPNWVYAINPAQDSVGGSFGFGVMTAVLSTPCTAPFMGGAAAWAVTQTPPVTVTTFGAIGVGMALPYFLLTLFPGLVRRMPRTGPASELIKQVMGLFMLAAAAFFVGTGLSGLLVTPPDPPTRMYWWAVGLIAAAGGVWLAWRTFRITPSPVRRAVFGGLGVLVAAGSVYIAVRATDHGPIKWTYYTPERFAQAQREGQVVVMDFTAEWCLNCKVIEANVLHQPRTVAAIEGPGVLAMKVDLTSNNAAGNDMLRKVGRVMIPALVVFAPDGTQTINADAYTVDQVIDAIARARGESKE